MTLSEGLARMHDTREALEVARQGLRNAEDAHENALLTLAQYLGTIGHRVRQCEVIADELAQVEA